MEIYKFLPDICTILPDNYKNLPDIINVILPGNKIFKFYFDVDHSEFRDNLSVGGSKILRLKKKVVGRSFASKWMTMDNMGQSRSRSIESI